MVYIVSMPKRKLTSEDSRQRQKPKICEQDKCIKQARGGGQGILKYCGQHGGGKRCHEPKCTKGAVGATDYCNAHMGGRRCDELECMKSARSGSDYCVAHKGGKRCNEPECTKSAVGATDYCVAHKGGKRCNEPECTKSAQRATDYCIAHKGGKRCNEPDCTKSAVGATNYCRGHGGGNRCSGCAVFSVNRKGFLCSICDPTSKSRAMTTQGKVEAALTAAGFLFEHEVRIDFACAENDEEKKFAKLDVVIERPEKRVIIEIDEQQHREGGLFGYTTTCDVARMTKIMHSIALSGNGRPTLQIRYNPDAFRIDGKLEHVPTPKRLETLFSIVRDYVVQGEFQVVYLNYDRDESGCLCILPYIDPTFRQFIVNSSCE